MTQSSENLGAMIRLIFTVVAVVFAWKYMVVPSLQDTLKARIFDLRREMFLYAAEGNISHCDPAYVRIRYVMNGVVNNIDQITFGRLWLFSKLSPTAPAFASPIEQALFDIQDQQVMHRMCKFLIDLHVALGLYMLISPLAWAWALYLAIREGIKNSLLKLAALIPADWTEDSDISASAEAA